MATTNNQLSVRERVVAIVRQVGNIQHDTADTALLRDDLGFTSLNFIELIVEIETAFNAVVPDEVVVADRIQTVGDLVQVVEAIA